MDSLARINNILKKLLPVMFVSLCFFSIGRGETLKPVTVELKWFHQFQFAGIYAAKAEGFYKKAGLKVTIVKRNIKSSPLKDVLSDKVDFGVSDSTIIQEKLLGKPLVLLAAIFQHSPLVLITLERNKILSPLELKGKRVMYQKNVDDAIVGGMFSGFGMTSKDFVHIPHNFNDMALIDDNVDAMSAYLSNQPWLYKQKNIDINIIKPQNYGVDFYGDIIFTSQNFFKKNKKIALAFRQATIDGWKYALEHPEKIIDLIQKEYGTKKSQQALEYEAEIIKRMVVPEHVPIGHVNKERLKNIALYYHRNNPKIKNQSIEGLYYLDHVSPIKRYKVVIIIAAIALFLAVIVIFVMFLFAWKLNQKVKERTAKIEAISTTDELTKVANRRKLLEVLKNLKERKNRFKDSFSIIMLDIDFFKKINDTHGHNVGDIVLKKIAETIKACIRKTDFIGRWGGEEFIVVCANTSLINAYNFAEKIRKAIENSFSYEEINNTVSIGVSEYRQNETIELLISRADTALYQSKNSGRNKTTLEEK